MTATRINLAPIVQTFTAGTSAVAAGSMFYFNVPYTVPAGYQIGGVIGYSTGSRYLQVSNLDWDDSRVRIGGRNNATGQADANTATVHVLFVPA